MKVMFGYFVGEFGWELLCWQGILRLMHKKYGGDFDKIYIAGRFGHDMIYSDFAEYVPMKGIGSETSGMRNKDYTFIPLHKKYNDVTHVLPPESYLTHYNPRNRNNVKFLNTKQKFIKYGIRKKTNIRILVHARYTDKWQSGSRNWGKVMWDELIDSLIKQGYIVGAIGIKSQAYKPKGTKDLMNIELKYLVDYMRSADSVIGSSSGPMHLAALTDTPRVVWGMPELEKTYKEHWNPFNVPVEFISTWDPSVENVLKSVNKLLK